MSLKARPFLTKFRFRRRAFHEPNLIRIKTDPNYLDRLNWFELNSSRTKFRRRKMLISVKLLSNLRIGLGKWKVRRLSQRLFTIYMGNRSVYGLGKWYAKFRTGKFSAGIAFTICTDQFHLTENGREGLKLVSKMALRKWNTNFRLEYFVRKNRTTFSDVPLLQEIFRWEDPKSRVPFTFELDFPENSCPKAKFPAGLG